MDEFKSPIAHWTPSRYWTFIRSALRKAWGKYPAKFDVLKNRRRNKPKDVVGKHKFEYQCAECKNWFQQKHIAVDHIIPAGKLQGFDDLPQFCENLFTSVDGLQILCDNGSKSCHKIKTRQERGISETDYAVNCFAKEKVDKQKGILLKYGYSGADVSNLTKRKGVYRTLIEEEKING